MRVVSVNVGIQDLLKFDPLLHQRNPIEVFLWIAISSGHISRFVLTDNLLIDQRRVFSPRRCLKSVPSSLRLNPHFCHFVHPCFQLLHHCWQNFYWYLFRTWYSIDSIYYSDPINPPSITLTSDAVSFCGGQRTINTVKGWQVQWTPRPQDDLVLPLLASCW